MKLPGWLVANTERSGADGEINVKCRAVGIAVEDLQEKLGILRGREWGWVQWFTLYTLGGCIWRGSKKRRKKKKSKAVNEASPSPLCPSFPNDPIFLFFLFYYLLTWTSRSATMTASTSTSSSTSIHMPVWLGHLGLPCADIPPSTPGTLSSGGNLSSETHRCPPACSFYCNLL